MENPAQNPYDAIERHVEEHFGPIEFVFHAVPSTGVHVLVAGPTEERPFRTLVTEGMSDRPMKVPDGVSPFAELLLCLPVDWPIEDLAADDSWPVHLIKYLAAFPHENDTWLGAWHLLPNGDPAVPYAPNTPFAGMVITPVLRTSAAGREIDGDQAKIDLLAVIPLHPAEIRLKAEQGASALIAAFDRAGVSELVDPARPSSV
ncbi:suppressor of fused domain protein [Lentzea sp. NPDC058450]|uniref:suppressor of fused domain protein n=1 Tax=Lentzea sp. NPDC058450 TaxID=3346505 RepID=UPI00364F102F